MKLNVFKILTALGCIVLGGCSGKDNNLSIQFNKDSTAVVVANIDEIGFNLLKDGYVRGHQLDSLISVVEIPGDDDSTAMERTFPGKVVINKKTLVFTPSEAFKKGKYYLVTSSLNVRLGGTAKAMRNQLNTANRPNEKILAR